MSCRFMCPQGHLLEGDYSQMGQTVQCPDCGVAFVVPTVDAPEGAVDQTMDYVPPQNFQQELQQEPAPNFDTTGGAVGFFDQLGSSAPPSEKIIHVPCPQGHVLETTFDTMGQSVMCPHCGDLFELSYRNSYEGKQERRLAEDKRIRRSGQLWMNWAIAIAVLVVIGLIAMFAMMR